MESAKLISDTVFLALTVWREARAESTDGKIAVARSILNRVARPSWWGNDVMSVVFKKWQYSSLTDPNDKQLAKWPDAKDNSWWECVQIARDLVHGANLPNPAPGADSYYATYIPAPKWATPETFVAQVGSQRFYNLDHDMELAVCHGTSS